MSETVNLPALGESVTEGTVTRWLKQVGDRVEVDEPLVEVSTDKVDTEGPSPVAGVIEEIFVAEDEDAEVGAPLVRIGEQIGEAQLIVNWEAYPEDVSQLIHAHPTQNEALGEAAMALAGAPLHG